MDHIDIKGQRVFGLLVDSQTRCEHYAGPTDVIAIKFHCCRRWYPCHACHDAREEHDRSVWPRTEFGQPAVLCGACGVQLTVSEYLASGFHCPRCEASFNPGCRRHYALYFET